MNSTCVNGIEIGDICKCDPHWTTFPEDSDELCNYGQTSWVLVLCMQIFFGYLGVADFIVGRIGIGVGKVVLSIFPCLGGCCAFGSVAADSDGCAICWASTGVCFIYLSALGSLVWWIVDIVFYAQNSIQDSNGVVLYT